MINVRLDLSAEEFKNLALDGRGSASEELKRILAAVVAVSPVAESKPEVKRVTAKK